MQTRAAAQAFIIPLSKARQKPQNGNWLNERIAAMAAPPPPSALRELLSNRSEVYPLGMNGRSVIKLNSWKHAETDHFVVHYVQNADAYPVMRYIECAFFVVTQTLQIDTSVSKRKSHVFIFPDTASWKDFTSTLKMPTRVSGFAYKDELLLGAPDERDVYLKILCHEATHAVVARYYPGHKWPLWLNEGFAEYMSAKSLALRRSHQIQRYLSQNVTGSFFVNSVFNRLTYGIPTNTSYGGTDPVTAFYRESEKCVRVLLEKLPAGAFPRFANCVVAGNSMNASFQAAYGAACADSALLN